MTDDPSHHPDPGARRRIPPATQPAPAQPEDRFAYRIAVAALGLALVAFLIGAAVIAAGGKPVPTQYWSTGSAIAGALMGILAPTPTPKYQGSEAPSKPRALLEAVVSVIVDLWQNRAVLILMVVFGVSLAFAITNSSAPLETVAAAAGGALVGLLAPPPV
jgi:hypothetical protein